MNNLNIKGALEKVKVNRPLVHCITNYVTANDCANITLALGGIPTMANNIHEVEEITSKAKALVINIGTLSEDAINAMILAGKTANKNNVPVVFDPVGAAASESRKNSALKILKEVNMAVIKGNMAEMKAILGMNGVAKGVDSIEDVNDKKAKEIVSFAAVKLNTIAIITGKIDYVSDGSKVITVANGVEIMTRVTGTGCMTNCLIGTFLGAGNNKMTSAVLGVVSMGVAGEKAYESLRENEGSGTFRVKLMDEVYNLTSDVLEKRGKIDE